MQNSFACKLKRQANIKCGSHTFYRAIAIVIKPQQDPQYWDLGTSNYQKIYCTNFSYGTVRYNPIYKIRTRSPQCLNMSKHITVSGNSLHWRHNELDGVSTHQPRDCLFTCLFWHRSKKTSKLRVTGLCAGNSPGPVNSPHKRPVTRKMFPFDDVIMISFHETDYQSTLVFYEVSSLHVLDFEYSRGWRHPKFPMKWNTRHFEC